MTTWQVSPKTQVARTVLRPAALSKEHRFIPTAGSMETNLQLFTDRAEWMQHANCRGLDPALFYPERGDKGIEHARAVCNACPVQAECLQYAVDNCENAGIWGGATREERQGIRVRTIGRPPRTTIDHGTNAGYAAHRRNNDRPCPECLRAHADYELYKATA